jgi:uncharacterized protein (DUF433 family)
VNAETTIIKAFSIEQASRLSGLTPQRLMTWDRSGFFQPSYADENRRVAYSRIYSFEDVVDLRTLAILRDTYNVQLGELRKAALKLKEDGGRPWTGRKIYVFRGKVAFDDPDNGLPRNVTDGQFIQNCIPLESIAAEVSDRSQKMRGRPEGTQGKVSRNKFIAGNQWVIDGTRIPTSAIKEFADAGYDPAQIIEQYPDLTEADIKAALRHERKKKAA